jgi:hypothetical protein
MGANVAGARKHSSQFRYVAVLFLGAAISGCPVAPSTSRTAAVDAPTFSPGAGSYSVPLQVRISCTVSGAAIYYTTDGSDPTATHGTLYSSALTVTISTTLKAVAHDASLGDSAIAAATYTILPGFPLAVGPTGRYLVDSDGRPFLLTGDAAWSLMAQLSDEDVDTYLDSRRNLGFNTVLVNLIEHHFASSPPANYYGFSPFTGAPFSTPNPDYFAHADHVIQSAAARGMLVLLDPAYLGYNLGSEGWAAEIAAASEEEMTAWGRFLGNRYSQCANIIWVIGGDTDPTTLKTKLQCVVSGIRQYAPDHLFTAHNGQESMAIDPWGGATWLSVNNIYTYSPAYLLAQTAYSVSPSTPFFLIEARYENEDTTTGPQLRAESYGTMLSGGFGHVFGNCPIWSFGITQCGASGTSMSWKTELDGQGSRNMRCFARLFTSRHWHALVPDLAHAVLTDGYGASGGSDFATAASASDGSSVVVYLPTPRTVTISAAGLAGGSMNAWWYDPSTGTASGIGTYPTSSTRTFTPPTGGEGDWVLVLDSVSFGFSAPGA